MAYSRFLEIDIAASSDEGFLKIGRNLRAMLTVQHPNFTRDSSEHDLMLVKLIKPLKPNDEVKLANLPTSTEDRREDTCTVSGWGWSWENFGE